MHWYLNFFEKFNQTLYLFSRSFAPDSRFSEFSTDCSKVLETIEKTTIIKPQSSTTNEGSRFSEFSIDCSKVLETIEKTIIIKPQSSKRTQDLVNSPLTAQKRWKLLKKQPISNLNLRRRIRLKRKSKWQHI